jgi:hypothetical protein
LNKRNHHAVAIRRGQVDGAAAKRFAGAGRRCPLGVDQPGALCQICRVEQVGRCDFRHVIHIADVFMQVGKGQFHCLDLQVHRQRAILIQALQIEMP